MKKPASRHVSHRYLPCLFAMWLYGLAVPMMMNLGLSSASAQVTNGLLFSVDNGSLPASGAIAAWQTSFQQIDPPPTSLLPFQSIGGSAVVTNVEGIVWEQNRLVNATGFRLEDPLNTNNGDYAGYSPFPINGATIIAAVTPQTYNGGGPWNDIVDVFFNQLSLGVLPNTGVITVGINDSNSVNNVYTLPANTALPANQPVVISLVVQPNGAFTVYTNGTRIYSHTASLPAGHGYTQLAPGTGGRTYADYIDIGREDPDGWSAFNGLIGDVYVYTNALSTADRQTMETFLKNKYIPASTYTITASAGVGGSITPSGAAQCAPGGNMPFHINAQAGYGVNDVIVDGVSQGATSTYWFYNVATNHTISAIFTNTTFVVTASVGPGGTINPSGNTVVNYGATPTYTITPDNGYTISSVVVNGFSEGAFSSYTFPGITANPNAYTNNVISATFAAVPSTPPVLSMSTPSQSSGSFSITWPNAYQHQLLWSSNLGPDAVWIPVPGTPTNLGGLYEFPLMMAGVNQAFFSLGNSTFTPSSFTVTASTGAGGTINPAGSVTVANGSDQTFTIIPNSGYAISAVAVDGVYQGQIDSYTFTNVSANHAITPFFVPVATSRAPTVGISVNYDIATGTTPPVGTSTSAGVNALANWNDVTNFTTTATANLFDSTGATVSGFTAKLSNGNYTSWNTSGSANQNLLSDWALNNGGSLTLSGIPYANYHLYAYFTGFGGSPPNIVKYTIGSQQQWLTNTLGSPNNFTSFDEGNNYVVLTNLTGSSQTLNVAGVSGGTYGLAGFQIIEDDVITATAGSGGTISPSGSVLVNGGSSQTFTITPDSGEIISNVTVDGNSVGAVNSYTFAGVNTSHTISATFTTASSGSNPLTVTTIGNGITSLAEGTYNYSPGSVVTVAATPSPGWLFSGWSGAATGSANPVSVTMNGAEVLTATFTPVTNGFYTWPSYSPKIAYSFKGEWPNVSAPTNIMPVGCNVAGTYAKGWWCFYYGPNKNSLVTSNAWIPMINFMNTNFYYLCDVMGFPRDQMALNGYYSSIFLYGSGLCTDNASNTATGGWQSWIQYHGTNWPMVLISYYPVYCFDPSCPYSDIAFQQNAVIHEGLHNIIDAMPGCLNDCWMNEGGNAWIQAEMTVDKNLATGDTNTYNSMGYLCAGPQMAVFQPIETYSGWLQDGSFAGPCNEGHVNEFTNSVSSVTNNGVVSYVTNTVSLCTWKTLLGGTGFTESFCHAMEVILGPQSIAWCYRYCDKSGRMLQDLAQVPNGLGDGQTRRLIQEYRARQAFGDFGVWSTAFKNATSLYWGEAIGPNYSPYWINCPTWTATCYVATTNNVGTLTPAAWTLPGWTGANQIPLTVSGSTATVTFNPIGQDMSCQLVYQDTNGNVRYSKPVTSGTCSIPLIDVKNNVVVAVICNTDYIFDPATSPYKKYAYTLTLGPGVTGTADIHTQWFQ